MKSYEAVEELDRAFQELVDGNPEVSEQMLKRAGMDGFMLKEMFHGWWIALREANESGDRAPPGFGITESVVLRGVRRAISLISRPGFLDASATRNQFVDEISNLDLLIWSISGRRSERYGVEEYREIRRALESSRKINAASESISESVKGVESAFLKARRDAAQIHEEGMRARSLLAESEVARASLDAVSKTLSDRAADAERIHSELQSMREAAEGRREYFDTSLGEISSKAQQAEAYLENTVRELRSTLDSVKRHGLASAFAQRAHELKRERYIWIVLFVAALLGLIAVSIVFAAKLEVLTYEAILTSLFRRIALAAPLVWLGWYAARQVGTISKLKEDYDYKAATAVAFEGYQKEVASSGDHALVAKLLDTAIHNFGDNPVRLYHGDHAEAASPSEEILKKIVAEGGSGVLGRIKDLVGKS